MTAPNTKCSVCNTHCYKRPSEISKSKSGKVYCSKICYGVDNRSAIRICPVCNESELKHRTSKTCSRKCSNRSRLGAVYSGRPTNDNATSLRAIRNRLFRCRGALCESCGFDNANILHIHHVIEKHNGGTNEDSNLQILCPNCHYTIHHGDSRI